MLNPEPRHFTSHFMFQFQWHLCRVLNDSFTGPSEIRFLLGKRNGFPAGAHFTAQFAALTFYSISRLNRTGKNTDNYFKAFRSLLSRDSVPGSCASLSPWLIPAQRERCTLTTGCTQGDVNSLLALLVRNLSFQFISHVHCSSVL